MKFLINLLVIIIAVAALFVGEVQTAGHNQENTAVYRVPVEARDMLTKMDATVRHGRMDGDFVAELTTEQADLLLSGGFEPEKLFDSPAEEDMIQLSDPSFAEFHSYGEMYNGFIDMATANPDIAELVIIGQSVQRRDIFALRISDNISEEEDEPELGFWGCIHGNEHGSAEMPYLYAEYLLDNYGIDPNVTSYVDNNEIWCLPIINPDGKVANNRENANGVDLNRDLGYNWDGWGDSWYPFSQPETQALRELSMANNFSVSTTYHCFGNEFYYPWGFFPTHAPDYGVLLRLGQRYANMAGYEFMSSFQSFQTHGEVLDWAYGCFGQLSYTAEVSNSSGMVNETFDRNRPGMNLYCRVAGKGIHGLVTDAETGEPLEAAIWIHNSAIPCYSDPSVGDFHRLVLPGFYSVTAYANGYVPFTANNVAVSFGSPGEANFQLEPEHSEHAYMVTSINQNDPNDAHKNRTYGGWALGEPDGYPCSIGSSGFIVLDMGEGHRIVDGAGYDFTITEAMIPWDSTSEAYRVYAGDAYVTDILIGMGTGTESFDLDGSGVTSTRYLKVVDYSGSSPDGPFPGLDLDAVTIINSGE